MTTIDLAAFGLTPETLADRIVDKAVADILQGISDDGEGSYRDTFSHKIQERITQQIDAAVDKLAADYVLPQVETLIASMTFQKSNRWGEPKGEVRTFREYLVDTATGWMSEQVNYNGKTKGEDSYNWRATNTRLGHMIHQHLDNRIAEAVKDAMANASKLFAGGLEGIIKLKLQEVSEQFKIEVKTR